MICTVLVSSLHESLIYSLGPFDYHDCNFNNPASVLNDGKIINQISQWYKFYLSTRIEFFRDRINKIFLLVLQKVGRMLLPDFLNSSQFFQFLEKVQRSVFNDERVADPHTLILDGGCLRVQKLFQMLLWIFCQFLKSRSHSVRTGVSIGELLCLYFWQDFLRFTGHNYHSGCRASVLQTGFERFADYGCHRASNKEI